ncbi:mechanosensitive ion channel family protein [Pedobacter sp. N23S346]|uniref:mechanosensitive ion channel family protein n=1 Tax=Pedobacter sp. N23S346 TaxID=3402750 RepID=UPI003AC9E0FE
MKFAVRKKYLFLSFILSSLVFASSFCKGQNTENRTVDSAKTIPDTLLFKLQSAQSAITEINAVNKKGYDVEGIRRQIDAVKENVNPLVKAFKAKDDLDTKNLLSFNLILRDADTKLKGITAILVQNSNALQKMSDQVVSVSNDTLLKNDEKGLPGSKLYQPQINEIKSRLQDAGQLTGKNLEQVNVLLANASALNVMVNDLRAQTAEKLELSGKLALSKRDPYLWEAPLRNSASNTTGNLISASYQGQQQILKYFIHSTWDNRLLAILISIAFFVWVRRNFRNSKRALVRRQLGEIKFEYLKPLPVFSTIIVLLNITPLFEPDAPSLYIELIQFLLLVLMTVHLWNVLEKKQLQFWILLIALYTVLIVGNAGVDDTIPFRLVLIAINIFFIWIGIQLFNKVTFKEFSKKYVKAVLIVLLLMNVLAVLFNVFGRVDMAKVTSVTGVIGLIQLIGLSVFMQIMLDALDLQMKISACNKGIFSRINYNKAKEKFKKGLSFLCILLWVMVLLINLSLIGGLWSWLSEVLSKPRVFGSIHFSFGNILFFVIIVYIANKLQKHVPLLFGEERITFNEGSGHKGSKVALVRLVIIVAGVLLAVMASGLPMDKLTVVLGAFGVGIGLGMQNIVNNFVSGIILIFEKPFRIGDYVELADKKGKVRDIGIRSSKLLTPQGSEVIIPNGDLLSGRLVNWTLNNDFIKTELIFKVSADSDFEAISKLITSMLDEADNTVKKLPPEVLLNNITADSLEIKVLLWINNIYVEAEFKSQFLQQLVKKLKDAEVKIM